jgi:hypothetical protein
MSNLNLRDIDPELMRELHLAAAEAGWTLKELCVHRLKGVTYGEIRRKDQPQMIIAPESEKPRATEIPQAIERPVKLEGCPRCGGETIAWGSMRRCQKCLQNWPVVTP